MNPASPLAYARQLTEYIADPSTVRVRVLEYFGDAPPIEKIRYYRSEVERLRAREWNYLLNPKWDDAFTGIEPRKPKPVKTVHKFEIPAAKRHPWPSWYTPPGQNKSNVGVARQLIQSLADLLKIDPAEIRGNGRSPHLVDARSIIATVLRARGWSYPMIGAQLGGKDHSTVINAVNRLPKRLERIPDLKAVLDYHMREFGL